MSLEITPLGKVDWRPLQASATPIAEASFTKVDERRIMVDLSQSLICRDHEQYSKGNPTFDELWNDSLELTDSHPSFRARMLLACLVGTGGDVWGRLMRELQKLEDPQLERETLWVFYWLLQYKEMPAPLPIYQSILDEKLRLFESSIVKSSFSRRPDYSQLELLIPWIVQYSLLLPDEQLESIWQNAHFEQMDQNKIQLLLICLQYFPPRFWKGKNSELTAIQSGIDPLNSLFNQLLRIILFSSAILEKPYECVLFLRTLGLRKDPLIAKSVFNLVWAKKEQLIPEQLSALLEVIVAPLELHQIALHINANHKNWDEAGFREIIDQGLLIDTVAVYLSEEVLFRYYGNHSLNGMKTAHLQEVFELGSCLLQKIDGVREAKLLALRDMAVFVHFVTKWQNSDSEAFRTWLESFLQSIATKLVFLKQSEMQERWIFGSFFRRARYSLSPEKSQDFLAAAISLSNNFHGNELYKSPNILFYLARELDNGKEWFKANQEPFVEIMEMENLFNDQGKWPGWKPVLALYEEYLTVKQGIKDWHSRAIVAYVNQNHKLPHDPLLEVVLGIVIKDGCDLNFLKRAVQPGQSLIDLLIQVEALAPSLSNNKFQLIFDWANIILKRSSNNAQFWQQAYDSFRSIVEKLPKPKSGRHVSFDDVWRKFKARIELSTSPEKILQLMIERKCAEVRIQIGSAFLKPVKSCENLLEKFLEIEDGADFKAEKKAASSAIETIFKTANAEIKIIVSNVSEQVAALSEITQATELQKRLHDIAANASKLAENKASELEKNVHEIGEKCFEKIRGLKKELEFRALQNELLDLPRPESAVKELEAIVLRQKKWEKTREDLHRAAIGKATTKDQLKGIQAGFENDWAENGLELFARVGMLVQDKLPVKETRETRIIKHQQDELEKLREKLKKKKESKAHLRSENELLKQRLDKIATLETKEIVVEKPVQLLLIEKLRALSAFSPNALQALPMIEMEGKILRSIPDIVKFLALFHLKYVRTRGSHKIYSDGKEEVVISNHEGESKPEEVKEALEVVLRVISKI